MSKTKNVKNYIYEGLGFPVILKDAEVRLVRGEWLLKVDVEQVADKLIKALPTKPVGLTGAEIKFIRTYFDLSLRKFADELNVTHTAVGNWEEADQNRAKIDAHVEINLRAWVKLKLDEKKDFSDFYQHLIEDSKHFGDKAIQPMSIALEA